MKTLPIVPAEIDFESSLDGVPWSQRFDDRYHPRAGAFEQAHQVFMAGNGLPQRWRGRERFVVLETGFGLGNNFLATWAAWRDDARRCERLDFVSIERHPPRLEDLRRAHAATPAPALAARLIEAWPPLTPNLHLLAFDAARVRLLLALGDIRTCLHELVLQADAFYLDGFAPERNPQMWTRDVMKLLARLAAPDATLATWSAAAPVRDGLRSAGFEVARVPGFGGKRVMTVARHAPRFVAQRPAGRPDFNARAGSAGARRDVLVIGAGLAGAAAAHALAEQGFECQVLEAARGAATLSSGNPGGLFHGTVHADDGLHARWQRAAALHAARVLAPPVRCGAVAGQVEGLLRLETRRGHANMVALIRSLGLGDDYVMALDSAQASQRAGLALATPAWWYPGGGWIDPAAWVEHQLRHPLVHLVLDATVRSLQATGDGWRALDADGRCLAEAGHVVIATGVALARLAGLEGLDGLGGRGAIPLEVIRGQVTRVPSQLRPTPPRIPISGEGYALTLPGGDVLCGATSDRGDTDPGVRAADAALNLIRLERITGPLLPGAQADHLPGRVGWRLTSADRLPLIGALAAPAVPCQRLDQPRFLPRQRGLFVLGALGSRGIASAALGAEILAAWISAAPLPVEASLLDAVDPVRGVSRQARRAKTPTD